MSTQETINAFPELKGWKRVAKAKLFNAEIRLFVDPSDEERFVLVSEESGVFKKLESYDLGDFEARASDHISSSNKSTKKAWFEFVQSNQQEFCSLVIQQVADRSFQYGGFSLANVIKDAKRLLSEATSDVETGSNEDGLHIMPKGGMCSEFMDACFGIMIDVEDKNVYVTLATD